MLILNKKYYFWEIGILSVLGVLLLFSETQAAVSIKIRQAKTADNSAVYYLDHNTHRKKVYINANSYLSYGNKWSDIKIVSAAELNAWEDIKLFKLKGSPAIYYIQGAKRTLILNMTDLQDFSLAAEPIVTVSEIDLNQYQLASYEEIGLQRTSNFLLINDLVSNENNNTLLTNTGGNLVGIFRFRSPAETATITSLTVKIGGLYNDVILDSAFMSDANGNSYDANVSLRRSAKEIYISFPEPLTFSPGEEKTLEIFLSFKTCSCSNQTLWVGFEKASDIVASLPVAGTFPIKGATFNILAADTLIGQVKTQEKTLVGTNLAVSNGSRLIGKFTISEESGNESVLIKRVTFTNSGSAGKNDWEDFRLLANDQIIARVSEVDNDDHDKIIFNVNYLSVEHGSPVELKVLAGLKTDYSPSATYDLQISGLWSTGQTNKFSLQPTINNLGENYTLN